MMPRALAVGPWFHRLQIFPTLHVYSHGARTRRGGVDRAARPGPQHSLRRMCVRPAPHNFEMKPPCMYESKTRGNDRMMHVHA